MTKKLIEKVRKEWSEVLKKREEELEDEFKDLQRSIFLSGEKKRSQNGSGENKKEDSNSAILINETFSNGGSPFKVLE